MHLHGTDTIDGLMIHGRSGGESPLFVQMDNM